MEGEQLSPADATAERAALMGDAGFRERAAKGGAEWGQIAALDRAIAAGKADEAADEAKASAEPQADEQAENFADFYTLPDTPAGYELPTQLARERGLAVDPMAEIELRQSLHKAGVDGPLATTLYWSALNAQTAADSSPVAQETQYRASAHALHQAWGKDYEANLALANTEARRVFDALPKSITNGASFVSVSPRHLDCRGAF